MKNLHNQNVCSLGNNKPTFVSRYKYNHYYYSFERSKDYRDKKMSRQTDVSRQPIHLVICVAQIIDL